MFPDLLLELIRLHLQQVKAQHDWDLAQGFGTVYLPYALERNIRTPAENLLGNMSFLPPSFPLIPSAASNGDII